MLQTFPNVTSLGLRSKLYQAKITKFTGGSQEVKKLHFCTNRHPIAIWEVITRHKNWLNDRKGNTRFKTQSSLV